MNALKKQGMEMGWMVRTSPMSAESLTEDSET